VAESEKSDEQQKEKGERISFREKKGRTCRKWMMPSGGQFVTTNPREARGKNSPSIVQKKEQPTSTGQQGGGHQN